MCAQGVCFRNRPEQVSLLTFLSLWPAGLSGSPHLCRTHINSYHFPGGVEDHTDRYSGWRLEVGSLVTAQWLRTESGQKRCAEVRSSMKLSRSRAGKAEFKGNGELRNMTLATRLLKNQQGLSSAQTLFRIFLNVTRSTILGPFLPHLPTYSLLRHTDSPAFPQTHICQLSLFSSLLGSPSLD